MHDDDFAENRPWTALISALPEDDRGSSHKTARFVIPTVTAGH